RGFLLGRFSNTGRGSDSAQRFAATRIRKPSPEPTFVPNAADGRCQPFPAGRDSAALVESGEADHGKRTRGAAAKPNQRSHLGGQNFNLGFEYKVAHMVGPITKAPNPSYGPRRMNTVDGPGPCLALIFPGVVGQIS
ncbi:hypothetical protein, partial [Palleronia aestuarii]|uniref:hypothetical protein n=1 Tax=Palleronia aestuarii TaxID=568105 RepID=UPI001B87E34F